MNLFFLEANLRMFSQQINFKVRKSKIKFQNLQDKNYKHESLTQN